MNVEQAVMLLNYLKKEESASEKQDVRRTEQPA